jgi:Ca2+-binding EF-hand superfamily protein
VRVGVVTLSVVGSEFSDRLFKMFDTDQSGKIDFKEFVTAITIMSQKVSHVDTIRMAFKAFDKNHDGTISLDELRSVLRNCWRALTEEV